MLRALLLVLLIPGVVWLSPRQAHAQVGIGSGRERDVLRLLQPYRDEGPVGAATLVGIAIERDRIVLHLQDPAKQGADLVLRPLPSPGAHAFAIEQPPAPTPDLTRAQDLLREAVTAHDDGSFFATVPAIAGEVPPSPLRLLLLRLGCGALWLLVGLAVFVQLARRPRWRWLVLLLTWVLAMQARDSVPFWLLHANQHAFEDAAVALDVPEAQLSTSRALDEYGAGWLVLQRAVVPVFGATWHGLARSSAAIGGLAVALTLEAALVAGASLPWALLGTLVFALAPIAVRVGHSESVLVLAQLLMAVVALLAAGGQRLDRLGLQAAVLLLALGHPLGPAYAVGAALLAWALLPPVPPPPAGPERFLLLPDGTLAGQLGSKLTRKMQALHLLPALGLLATLVVGVGIQLAGNAALLKNRTAAVDQALPWPTNPWQFLLWLDPAWAPIAFLVVAVLGTWGWLRFRRDVVRAETWRALALPLGALAICAVGLVVVASVSDGLRYQAPLAPALVLLAAFAGHVAAGPGRLVAWLAAATTLVELARPMPGRTALDGQGQAWLALQAELATRQGDVWLLEPDREPGKRAVVVEVPLGRLDRGGPTLRALRTGSLAQACRDGLVVPRPVLAWLPPDCDVAELPGVTPSCRVLADLGGPPIATGEVTYLVPRHPHGLPGEFHRHPRRRGEWRLLEARCPQAK